jgi:hypothetical protein
MTILFLGIDLNRNDLLKNFTLLKNRASCFFLENFSPLEVSGSMAGEIGKIIYWKDFSDAFELIESIKPDKIVYALIDNYYHFALFFAARQNNIPIFYIDHGIRFEEEIEQVYGMYHKKGLAFSINKSYPKAALGYYKHRFFRKTVKKLPKAEGKILKKLFIDRTILDYGPFMIKDGHYLQPDDFIIYSEETWKYHKFLFGFTSRKPRIQFTGIPALDEFTELGKVPFGHKKPGVLYIDQPLHEQNLLGWKRESKIEHLRMLASIVHEQGYKLYVKPHPWNETLYDEAMAESKEFEVLNEMDFTFIQNNIRVVIGYNSTLLLGFCALENFLTICITDHPVIFTPNLSQGIVKYHVAVEVKNINELGNVLKYPANYMKDKTDHLKEFHSGMMFSFDGMALKRTLDYLVQ